MPIMINMILGIFIGIILGIFIQKYVFAYLDVVFEIFTYRQVEKAIKYQINSQRITYDFYREYPEALEQEENQEEHTNAIGFQYEPEYYDEDEE